MFKIQTQVGNEVKVSFKHNVKPTVPYILPLSGKRQERAATFCAIEKDGEIVGQGMAICNPVDGFCKETGRKIALADALVSAGVTRHVRSLFWEQYFASKNGHA